MSLLPKICNSSWFSRALTHECAHPMSSTSNLVRHSWFVTSPTWSLLMTRSVTNQSIMLQSKVYTSRLFGFGVEFLKIKMGLNLNRWDTLEWEQPLSTLFFILRWRTSLSLATVLVEVSKVSCLYLKMVVNQRTSLFNLFYNYSFKTRIVNRFVD